jgi:hypothetical protein
MSYLKKPVSENLNLPSVETLKNKILHVKDLLKFLKREIQRIRKIKEFFMLVISVYIQEKIWFLWTRQILIIIYQKFTEILKSIQRLLDMFRQIKA